MEARNVGQIKTRKDFSLRCTFCMKFVPLQALAMELAGSHPPPLACGWGARLSCCRGTPTALSCTHNTSHWWILEKKTDKALGLYFVSPDGRGGHPLMVCQNTKEHLCSIVPRPIRWQGYDTLQMILGILGHRQRVSSSPAPVAGI